MMLVILSCPYRGQLRQLHALMDKQPVLTQMYVVKQLEMVPIPAVLI